VLVTSTSVGNSGLLDTLLPAYERQHHVTFGVHLVGSGRALAMLADGDADVSISHAPRAEQAALAQHHDWWYRKIMFNDFVLVGPSTDPERVARSTTLEDALRRIAAGRTRFFSRADQSGTHEREQDLWAMARAHPPQERLIQTGEGMGTTLRITSAMAGYTLTDRATFVQLRPQLDLQIVKEGDSRLLNTYAVIANPANALAMDFARWLTDGGGRSTIDAYRVGANVQAFFPWPLDRPRERPENAPR